MERGNFAMRPRERRETSERDLFRSRFDQIIDMNHALVKLARTIDWGFLEERFGAVYTDKPGQPPLPTRLMTGLAILKHAYDLSAACCVPSGAIRPSSIRVHDALRFLDDWRARLVRQSFHSLRATLIGSMPAACHPRLLAPSRAGVVTWPIKAAGNLAGCILCNV